MKNRILSMICGIVMLFSVSCAGVQVGVDPEAVDVAIEVGAFTLGYEGCKKDTETFKEMAETAAVGLKLVEVDELTLEELLEELRTIGAESISNDPLTQYQVKKLLGLLDIRLDEKVVLIDDSKNRLIVIAVDAFILGVKTCEDNL